jgi:hypothetical protein
MSFSDKHVREVQPQLPFLSRLSVGGQAYGMVALVRSVKWLREWHQYFFPSEYEPNTTKAYKTRSHLPVRYVTPPTPVLPGVQGRFQTKIRSNAFEVTKINELYAEYFTASSSLPPTLPSLQLQIYQQSSPSMAAGSPLVPQEMTTNGTGRLPRLTKSSLLR